MHPLLLIQPAATMHQALKNISVERSSTRNSKFSEVNLQNNTKNILSNRIIPMIYFQPNLKEMLYLWHWL